MGKKVSVTGWVPKDETEMQTLEDGCLLDLDELRSKINNGIYPTKKKALSSEESEEWKKVRVTVEINVEKL